MNPRGLGLRQLESQDADIAGKPVVDLPSSSDVEWGIDIIKHEAHLNVFLDQALDQRAAH